MGKRTGSEKFSSQEKNSLKALVTGGTGFIGSHLTEALIENGVQVRCLRRKTSDLKWLKGLPIEFVHGDCNDKSSLGEAVRGVDWVFHLAGVTKAIQKETYFEVNGSGTENLIHACLENNPVFKNSSIFQARLRQGQVEMGATKRSQTPVNRFPIMAGATRGGRMGSCLCSRTSRSHRAAFCCLRAKG